MSKRIIKNIGKITGYTLLSVLLLVVLLVGCLYIPAVQDFLVPRVLEKVNSGSDTTFDVKQLRLKWPLDLSLKDVAMLEKGDTAMSARTAHLSVALWPLLSGNVKVSDIELDGVYYRQGTPDSTLYMLARVRAARLDRANVGLSAEEIDVNQLNVDGVRVDLRLLNDTTATPPDTAQVNWRIKAHGITLSNVEYRMQMLPTIDSLRAFVSTAHLTDGDIAMSSRKIDVAALEIDSVAATYLLPSPQWLAEHPNDTVTVTTDTTATMPWTIRANRLELTRSNAIYAVRDVLPAPGLDMNYLQVSDVSIRVDSFYNRATDITVPLKELHAVERSGIVLDAKGRFTMDSTMMRATAFDFTTLYSHLKLDAAMGIGDMTTDADLPLSLKANGAIGLRDIALAMPTIGTMISGIPSQTDILTDIDIAGSMRELLISRGDLALGDIASIKLDGALQNLNDINQLAGKITIDGNIRDGNTLKMSLLQAKSGSTLNIPPLRLAGIVSVDRGTYAGNLSATSSGGKLALDGQWNGNRESYDADLKLNKFPVNSFMPTLGVGTVTGALSARGHGYDPFSASTTIKISADVTEVVYNRRPLTNIVADATLTDGRANMSLISQNAPANFAVVADGNLDGTRYDWNYDINIKHLDLESLGLADSTAWGHLAVNGKVSLTPDLKFVNADADITGLTWHQGALSINGENLMMLLNATDSTTRASVTNRDLALNFYAGGGIDSLTRSLTATTIAMDSMRVRQRFDVAKLQSLLPPLDIKFNAGDANILTSILNDNNIQLDTLSFNIYNDTTLRADAFMRNLTIGTTRLDSIDIDMYQRRNALIYKIMLNNRPGTLDEFAHVVANGFISNDRLAVMFKQENISNQTGYRLGFVASMSDSANVSVRVVPGKPTIAYSQWHVNPDNHITYNLKNSHFTANLSMENSESRIHIFTADTDTIGLARQSDINVDIDNMRLQDWISLNPFAPPIKGDLSANLKVNFDNDAINGSGKASLANFYYGKQEVGTFDLDLDLHTLQRALFANVSLGVNGRKTIIASGALNDSTAVTPMHIDVTVDSLPLNIINPFMPPATASLKGALNGKMAATGRLVDPHLNGWLRFDSTAVTVTMLGTPYKFSSTEIPVNDNVVSFKNFAISGTNDNPLLVNGIVDATSFASPTINLSLSADEFGLVNNNKRARNAQVYGKAFIGLDATVRGSLSFLNINADLSLQPGTNVTYVMESDVSQLTSAGQSDMVKFVNFNDTTAVAKADSLTAPSSMMRINAILTVSDGTTVNVDLSPDGKNKASIQSEGTFDFTLDPMGDMRLTGRLNINKGFVRYTPPFMSEKLFNFNEGSYVAFNGAIMNPILNVHAVDRIRANVTQQGQNSRLIYFDVGLSVTGTLEQMNVAFDLSTDDDITVQNELQSMSAEQRANQAMNLLLYNIYTGKGTSADANLSGNMLYSFLASQLNNWAANSIKGVDISFGIDQYDRTIDGSTNQTTSYSYKVSKSLFDDRFKIVVGGNYSTDADADENFSQNLINDISFEYLINKQGTMYVRLFRHTGYESILEGEITQTGVGFVYKRKIKKLSDMFKPFRKRLTQAARQPVDSNDDEANSLHDTPITTKEDDDANAK